MRLIDADALIDDVNERYCKDCERRKGIKNGKKKVIYDIGDAPCRACPVDDMKDELENAPTVDAMPFCMYEKVMQKEIERRKALEPVKCEECKFYLGDGCDECTLLCAKSIIAILKDKRWYSDFYCAWGEKK